MWSRSALLVILFLSAGAGDGTAGEGELPAQAIGGETGVLRVMSARTLPPKVFGLSAYGQFYRSSELSTTDQTYTHLDGTGGIAGGIFDDPKILSLEGVLSVLAGSTSIKDEAGGLKRIVQPVGDLRAGVKLAHPFTGWFSLGADGYIELYTRVLDLGFDQRAIGYSTRLLSSFDVSGFIRFPWRIHLNLGYRGDRTRYLYQAPEFLSDGSRYSLGISLEDQYLLAGAMEFPLRAGPVGLTPFLEYSTEQYAGKISAYNISPQRATGGLRVTPLRGVNIDLAGDIGFARLIQAGEKTVRRLPLWNVILGGSYVIVPGQVVVEKIVTVPTAGERSPERGKVTGRVLDAGTSHPLGEAIISMADTGLTNLSADPKTGEYTTPDLKPGPLEITASMKGYETGKKKVTVETGKTVTADFSLKKIPPPAEAQPVPPPPPSPGKKARVILEKEKKKIEITETILFEHNRAGILEQSFPLLDEIAQVIKDNPDLTIRVEGHTDNVGKPSYNMWLSQARAEAVVKYLIGKGIPSRRLVAKGYGSTMPIAGNTTPEGRAKNRRVEFTIISE